MYLANILFFVFGASGALAAVSDSTITTVVTTTTSEASSSVGLSSTKYARTTDSASAIASTTTSRGIKKYVPTPSKPVSVTSSTATSSTVVDLAAADSAVTDLALTDFTATGSAASNSVTTSYATSGSAAGDFVTSNSTVVSSTTKRKAAKAIKSAKSVKSTTPVPEGNVSTALTTAATSSAGNDFTAPLAALLRNFYQKAVKIPEMPSRLRDLKAHQVTTTSNNTHHVAVNSGSAESSDKLNVVSMTELSSVTAKPTAKLSSVSASVPSIYSSVTEVKNIKSVTTSPEYSAPSYSKTKGKHPKASKTTAAAEATSTHGDKTSNSGSDTDYYGDEYRAGLNQGEIFGLETQCEDPEYDQSAIKIYQDSRLGLRDPQQSDYLFQGLMLEGFNVMLSPEPLLTVKYDDNQVVYLNDSLFNPYAVFRTNGWYLDTLGGKAAICPSQDLALAYIPDGEEPYCKDAVEVYLRIVPLPEIDEE